MPGFRFKLDPLLRTRRQTERERQRDVAVLEAERLALEASLRGEQQAITASKTDLGERLVGRLNIDAMRAQAASTMRHLRKANQLVIELAGVHQRLLAARGVLLEASRARRAVELLRERRYETWRKAVEKAEDAVLDELAVQRVEQGSGTMKKLWDLVSFMAVVNLFALLAFGGWLWFSDRLDADRVQRVRDLLAVTIAEEEQDDAEAATAADLAAQEAALEARKADPPLSSTAQLRLVRASGDRTRQASMRLEDEAELLRAAQDRRSAELDAREEAIAAREKAWREGNSGALEGRVQAQFQKTVDFYNMGAGPQAKQWLMELVAQGQVEQAVLYIDAMEPRAVAKTLKAMKSDAESELATKLLERLRTLGLDTEALEIPGNDDGAPARD